MAETTNPARRTQTPPTRGEVIRDTGSFILAWVLIFQQAMQPERFHLAFLLLAAVMSGTPAAIAAAGEFIGRQRPPTGDPPSLPSTPTTPE